MITDTLRNISARLRTGDIRGAESLAAEALIAEPDDPELNAFAAFIALQLNKQQAATRYAQIAAISGQARPTAQAANILAKLRVFDEAIAAARSINLADTSDPVVLDQAGACFSACAEHGDAEIAYARLVELFPNEPRCRFNLAASQRYNGKLSEAAANFDLAAAHGPQASEAAYARSLLKKATPENNYLADITARLSQPNPDPFARASLHYARGKELEDLGRWQDAFAAWTAGASALRKVHAYNAHAELTAMGETAKAWPIARRPVASAPLTPVFVVSLPRAGSTLLDRILLGLDKVESAGESEDFIVSLLEDDALAGLQDPVEIARQIGNVDIEAVGERYRASMKRRGHSDGYVIDKTPTNFLYVGLIAEALPEARFIHVERDAMDAALATYKTLFRDRYFWSYKLGDIAQYFNAYAKLMAHWHRNWPDRMERLRYEDLVARTESEATRLIQWLDLEWDPACLNFTNSKTGVSTASAEQVRQPIYSSSIGHWRNFKSELAEIERKLPPKLSN
jgi:Sulfotransferase family